MTNANFRRTLVGAAVATALGVLASPAGAAPYGGSFDPDSFAGQYIIDIGNDSCLTMVSGFISNDSFCGHMTLTSAFANVVNSVPPYSGLLTFAPPTSDLLGIYVNGGQIQSFDTNVIGPGAESPDSPGNDWFIQFVSGHMPPPPCYICDEFLTTADAIDPTLQGVYLYVNDGTSPIQRADYNGPAVRIPEPGTLSLLFGALGGGWLARRRRKEKVPDPN